MSLKNHFSVSLLSIFCLGLISGCASFDQQLYSQMQALEDSIRGYRLQYESMPAGAKIFCNGTELGTAPFYKYRNLSEDERQSGKLSIQGCEAVWNSGARASIDAVVPLNQFPRFVYLVADRPVEVPGAQGDDDVGIKILAERQKALNDLAVATGNLLALGVAIHDARSAAKHAAGTSFYVPANRNFRPVEGGGNIRWNWVHASAPVLSGPQSNFGLGDSFGNQVTLTAMYPASSCVGSIVNGQCLGKVLATGAPAGFCGGKVVHGRCYGSILMMQ